MRRRDRERRAREARTLRTPSALYVPDGALSGGCRCPLGLTFPPAEEEEQREDRERPLRRRRMAEEAAAEGEVPEEEVVAPFDVQQLDGMRKQLQVESIRMCVAASLVRVAWLTRRSLASAVGRKFQRFLVTFNDEAKGSALYIERIKNMCAGALPLA